MTVAVHTGMRRGELLALTWSDADLENGFVSVSHPKNDTPRKVPLNQSARSVLAGLKERSSSMMVFVKADGERITSRSIRKPFKRAIADARLEKFRFHDLRHTCGSWLTMAGVDVRRIPEVLGHKTIGMTLRYSRLAPNHSIDEVGKLDEFSRSHKPGQRGQARAE